MTEPPPSKKLKGRHVNINISDGISPRTGRSTNSSVLEQKLSVVEQRLQELQSFTFPTICRELSAIPSTMTVDPLVSLEIALLRQKESLL